MAPVGDSVFTPFGESGWADTDSIEKTEMAVTTARSLHMIPP